MCPCFTKLGQPLFSSIQPPPSPTLSLLPSLTRRLPAVSPATPSTGISRFCAPIVREVSWRAPSWIWVKELFAVVTRSDVYIISEPREICIPIDSYIL